RQAGTEQSRGNRQHHRCLQRRPPRNAIARIYYIAARGRSIFRRDCRRLARYINQLRQSAGGAVAVRFAEGLMAAWAGYVQSIGLTPEAIPSGRTTAIGGYCFLSSPSLTTLAGRDSA